MAVAASSLVRVERADDDRLTRVRRGLAVDEPLGRRRRAAATVADGLELVDELGAREELGHRPEGLSAEVLVEPGGDYPNAALGERERSVDDRRLEELHLVDPDDVAASRPGDELRAAVDRDGGHAHPRVADHVSRVVAVVDAALALAEGGVRVIAAGLDQDFRRQPFGPMPELLARAEFVDKLQAVCHRCGGPATTTQRLVDGRPAPYSGETIVVGALDSYEARCRDCHEAGADAVQLVA